MREQSAVVRLRGEHRPFAQCGDVAEMWRKQRGLSHPARSIRKAGIAEHRWQSKLARCDLLAEGHSQAVANVRGI
jgi:hypothetical protein